MYTSINQIARRLLSILVLLVLAACGGGGGGGSSDPFSLSTTNVSFAAFQYGPAPAPESVTVTVNSGTVYIGIQVSGSGFSADFQVMGGATGVVTISPATPNMAPGTYTGTVSVFGCSAIDCSSGQVAGSPKTIHVSYTVGVGIAAAPTFLTFDYVTGSADPATQTVNVVVSDGATWTASKTSTWLTLGSAGGVGSGSISVGVNPGGLVAGTYYGNVTLTVPTSGASRQLFVTLNVVAPALVVDQVSLHFGGTFGSAGSDFSVRTVNVSMNDGTAVNWTATPSAGWLVLGQTSGTTPGSFTVGINPAGLSVGSYTASITVSGSGLSASVTINVSLLVVNPPLVVTPGALSFGGADGGLDATGKSVQLVLGTGSNAYAWTASSNAAWLQVTPSSGSVSATPVPVTISVNPAGLSAGTYNGTITFTAQVNSLTVSTALAVSLQLDAHRIVVSDNGVALTSTPTLSRLTRSLSIRSSWGTADGWTAISDQPWLTVTASGTTADNLVLTADPTGLATNALHYATVTVSAGGPSVTNTETVRVGFWVGTQTPAAVTTISGSGSTVAADPIRPYVYRVNGSYVYAFNIYTGALVATVNAGSTIIYDHPAISSDGSRLYLADSSTILPLNLDTFTFESGWAPGTSSWQLTYARSNGVGLVISGDGRIYNPANGSVYSAALFAPGYTAVDRVRASRNGDMLCNQNTNLIPYTFSCRSLYVSVGGATNVMLGISKSTTGPSSTATVHIAGIDFVVNHDGTRAYVPSWNCCGSGNGQFLVYDLTQPSAMPVMQTITNYGNPTNAEEAFDGRIFLASEVSAGTDTWLYDASGTFLTSYDVSGASSGLFGDTLLVSGDALRVIGGTRVVTVGP